MEYLRLPATIFFFAGYLRSAMFVAVKVGRLYPCHFVLGKSSNYCFSKNCQRVTGFTESLNQLKRFWSVSKMFFLRGPSYESDRM